MYLENRTLKSSYDYHFTLFQLLFFVTSLILYTISLYLVAGIL